MTYKELKKYASNKDAIVGKSISVSVLSDSSSQFFVKALKGQGILNGMDFNIFEADYDQILMSILDSTSLFHKFISDYVIILKSSEKLVEQFYKLSSAEKATFAFDQIEYFKNLLLNIPSDSKVILNTFPRLVDNVFGNYSASVESSFGFQLSMLNLELKKLALVNGNLFLCDIETLQNLRGLNNRIDYKFYLKAKMTYSFDFLPTLVKNYVDIIKASAGIQLRKCLILDLDNTMWGGVIGDDGMNGIELGDLGKGRVFDELQRWAKALKNRGIILCICSKNTEHIAKEPFEKHPDMTLRLNDISVFVANWENKADNIRHIQQVLNIGFDSMVFIDDNPFERNLVREELPEVIVPELPEDPSEYMNYINTLNLFELASYSQEDSSRTKRYQEEAKRLATKKTYKSIDSYLENLQMESVIEPFNDYSIPRVAQLTQRSNQFNLRTKRYTEADIISIKNSNSYLTFQVNLKDKYGEYGLISLIIGEKREAGLFIDTWIMSCRVLKRDVEKFVLNELINQCKEHNIKYIIGEWLETKKNGLVKDHYKKLGFESKEGLWYLDTTDFVPLKNSIKKVEEKLV